MSKKTRLRVCRRRNSGTERLMASTGRKAMSSAAIIQSGKSSPTKGAIRPISQSSTSPASALPPGVGISVQLRTAVNKKPAITATV